MVAKFIPGVSAVAIPTAAAMGLSYRRFLLFKTIVTFCTCPNEASAALMAEQLIKAGYKRVRVLTGGKDALATLGA